MIQPLPLVSSISSWRLIMSFLLPCRNPFNPVHGTVTFTKNEVCVFLLFGPNIKCLVPNSYLINSALQIWNVPQADVIVFALDLFLFFFKLKFDLPTYSITPSAHPIKWSIPFHGNPIPVNSHIHSRTWCWLLGVYPQRFRCNETPGHLHPDVYSSNVYNSQTVEGASVSIERWMDKEDVVYV